MASVRSISPTVARRLAVTRQRLAGPRPSADATGIVDVVRDIELQYYLESGDERDRPPKLLDDMIKEGKLGCKSGEGFYTYPHPKYEDKAWLHKEKPYDDDLMKRLGITNQNYQ